VVFADFHFLDKYLIPLLLFCCLQSFLGNAKYKLSNHNATLIYRFESEAEPVVKLKLKIEINTREHFTVYGFTDFEHKMQNDWFDGSSKIKSYSLEELLSTKLRALYQRKKGRDLFDIYYSLINKTVNNKKVIAGLNTYLKNENLQIPQNDFLANMKEKMEDGEFIGDTKAL